MYPPASTISVDDIQVKMRLVYLVSVIQSIYPYKLNQRSTYETSSIKLNPIDDKLPVPNKA